MTENNHKLIKQYETMKQTIEASLKKLYDKQDILDIKEHFAKEIPSAVKIFVEFKHYCDAYSSDSYFIIENFKSYDRYRNELAVDEETQEGKVDHGLRCIFQGVEEQLLRRCQTVGYRGLELHIDLEHLTMY